MDIFKYRNELVKRFRAFSRSFTTIRAEDIRGEVDREYDDASRFWPDPILQINPNYKTDRSVHDLVGKPEIGLEPECERIFVHKGEPLSLYTHQENAIEMAGKGRSFVVTTGTGSGKSLSFFIPIVDRILKEKKAKPHEQRTRAVIIYPMNALANSQLESIRGFLENLPGVVSVARYTGQEGS